MIAESSDLLSFAIASAVAGEKHVPPRANRSAKLINLLGRDDSSEIESRENLCGFFCLKRCNRRSAALTRDDSHLFPVVGEFLAAVEAHNVSTSGESRGTSFTLFHRNRKTVVPVPTAKHSTENPGEHLPTSPATLSCRYRESGIIYLDSISGKRVRQGCSCGERVAYVNLE